ncbi:hypothetical protein ACOME3_004979 [Neoechinorhynchus agilis]
MHRIQELYNTECSYIGTLNVILKLQRKLSEHGILPHSEINKIFGKVEPIRDVHEIIRERLKEITANRRQNAMIGEIFLNLDEDLIKAYTPYVNILDEIRERVVDLRQRNRKFAELVKVIESDSCPSRQGFTDLLVKPVQRLGSIILLLDALLTVTPVDHPDRNALTDAVGKIRRVAESINKSKRLVEEGLVLLSLINDIQECPVDLYSRDRRLLLELTVRELSDEVIGTNHALTVFVFSDCMEIVKLKRHTMSRLSSFHGSILSTVNHRQRHSFKHVLMINMMSITNIHLCDPVIENVQSSPLTTTPAVSITFQDPPEPIDAILINPSSIIAGSEKELYRKSKTFVFQVDRVRSHITQRLSYYIHNKGDAIKSVGDMVDAIVERVVAMRRLEDPETIKVLTRVPDEPPMIGKRNWKSSLSRKLSRVFSNSGVDLPKHQGSIDGTTMSEPECPKLKSGIFSFLTRSQKSTSSPERLNQRRFSFKSQR